MKTAFTLLLPVLGLLLAPGITSATVWNLSASLSGLNEVPANPSPGIGVATLSLDDVTGAVTLTGSFSGLISPATVSHIHGPAPTTANAGVLLPLTVTASTSGTLTGGGTLSAANVGNMLNGLTYVNVHTGTLPGGEIRGQIYLVPEPATAAFLGLGLATIGLRLRRTR